MYINKIYIPIYIILLAKRTKWHSSAQERKSAKRVVER